MGDRSTWGPPGRRRGGGPGPAGAVVAAGADAGCRLRRCVLDAGRVPGPAGDGLDLLLGRLGDLGAPWWLGLVVPGPRGARAAAPGHPDPGPDLLDGGGGDGRRRPAAVLRRHRPAGRVQPGRPGVPAGRAPGRARRRRVAGRARPGRGRHAAPGAERSPSVVAVAAAAVPVGGLVWFLTAGQPELDEPLDPDIPAYMVQSSELGPEHGILVVRGSVEDGLRYTVRREDGIRLGEDEIVAHSDVGPAASTTWWPTLVSRPTPDGGGGAGRGRGRVRRAAGARGPRRRRRAGRHRRTGRGERRGPGHPGLAGRPAAVGGRARTGRARGCGSPCSSCRPWPSSRSWSCARPTSESGGVDEQVPRRPGGGRRHAGGLRRRAPGGPARPRATGATTYATSPSSPR